MRNWLIGVSLVAVLVGCQRSESGLEYPSAQRSFFALNVKCKDAYGKGINEIQRSLAFNDCNASRTAYAKQSQISGWVGVIKRISTDQGADVVSLDIVSKVDGFEITFRTVSNRLSDVTSGSLITQNNPLFTVLANMKEGALVTFDAVFLSDPSGDRGLWEASMTEQGAMSEPEFNVRFTSVRPFAQVSEGSGAQPASGMDVAVAEDVRQGATDARVSTALVGASPTSSLEVAMQEDQPKQPQSVVPDSVDDGRPSYRQMKAELIAAGYSPMASTSDQFNMAVDGDPASCGNAGCSVPWSKDGNDVCVGVSVNDNFPELDWSGGVSVGKCE